jgi:hypothetical protein
MGREAVTKCTWLQQSGEIKVLLETREVILRGEIRAKIPRASITEVTVKGDTLSVKAGNETLRLQLGPKEAKKWADILLKPPPTLAEKLGIDTKVKVFVIGNIDDRDLAAALSGSITQSIQDASMFVAMLRSEPDLETTMKTIGKASSHHIWCIYGKGKAATISDAMIRTFMRNQQYIDSKACAVSGHLTATRYRQGRDARQ